jgi:hypothetical protein
MKSVTGPHESEFHEIEVHCDCVNEAFRIVIADVVVDVLGK